MKIPKYVQIAISRYVRLGNEKYKQMIDNFVSKNKAKEEYVKMLLEDYIEFYNYKEESK